jgi:hypothetical protein
MQDIVLCVWHKMFATEGASGRVHDICIRSGFVRRVEFLEAG